MVNVAFGGIEVSRCTDCQGLFFDEFKKEELRKMKGADALDIGDVKTGREFNKVDQIQCPCCMSLMIRMVDLEQPHIWFEHCTVCGGSFFDAGEFKDLAHHTILDFFKDLITEGRSRTSRRPSRAQRRNPFLSR
jgi:Zn-finger nucleic acid-binding protein